MLWQIKNLNLLMHNQLIEIFFSDEDDSESQEDENDSRIQISQREHLINKTQEVWVNEEFEDNLDNSQSVKKKSQIVLIKLKKSK